MSSFSFAEYFREAQPVFDRISPDELLFAVGCLFGPIFLLLAFYRLIAKEASLFTKTVVWFVVSGVIHSSYELQFVFFRDGPIANAMDLYAAADFRYGRPLEEGTASMEMITALVVGPFCLLCAYAAVRDSSWRHPMQLMTSVCQIYGLTWFIFQPVFGKGLHSVSSQDPFLFWVIFVGLNAPWGIIPPILLIQSFWKVWSAMAAQQRSQVAKKTK